MSPVILAGWEVVFLAALCFYRTSLCPRFLSIYFVVMCPCTLGVLVWEFSAWFSSVFELILSFFFVFWSHALPPPNWSLGFFTPLWRTYYLPLIPWAYRLTIQAYLKPKTWKQSNEQQRWNVTLSENKCYTDGSAGNISGAIWNLFSPPSGSQWILFFFSSEWL